MLANTTRKEPAKVLAVIASFKNKAPAKMLVIGSTVLNMEARCPPIINVPAWKSITAHIPKVMENTTQRAHPLIVAGNANFPERMQTIDIVIEQVIAM